MWRFLAMIFVLVGSLSMGNDVFAAKNMPTIYADGVSCPNDCDAHVVFNKAHNGSKYASMPDSKRSAPVACKPGEACRVCFDDADDTCMEAIYRGGGPSKFRFDFTASFYEAKCPESDLPKTFSDQCKSFSKQYEKITATAFYCLNEPAAKGCAELIAAADKAKEADKPIYDECKQLGEAKFNAKYKGTPAMQRSLECAYEMHGTGKNSKGETWRRLLPAACYAGSYVDRSGLDCCDKNKMSLGGFGSECKIYTVPKT